MDCVEFDPSTPYCVYAHSMGGSIFYIGKGVAARPFLRTNRSARWLAYTAGRTYEISILGWFASDSEARDCECRLIVQHEPVCNAMHNGWAPSEENVQGLVERNRNRVWTVSQRAAKSFQAKSQGYFGRQVVPIKCRATETGYTKSSLAVRELGITASAMCNHLAGRLRRVCGFVFERMELDVDVDRISRAVLKIRAAKSELTREYDRRKAELDGQMETLEQVLLGHLHQNKVRSMACASATVSTEEVMQVNCEDWAAYHAWLIQEGALEGLERRVGRKFVESYAKQHDGELPPGITARRERVVRIRVSSEYA